MSSNKMLLISNLKKIKQHWKKSDDEVETETKNMKKWLKTQKHLPKIPGNKKIEFFLKSCEFNIEKAKESLDMYYTVRHLLPDLYENKHPCSEHMKESNKATDICILPHLTENLHRITVIRFKDTDQDKFVLSNYYATIFRNMFEITTEEDHSVGAIFLLDLEHITLEQVLQITPIMVKKVAIILDTVWADRLKEMHLVNAPPYFDRIVSLIHIFFSEKLREKVVVHQSMEDVFKVIPRDLLPSDYGGNEQSLSELTELWNQKLEEYKEVFDEMEHLKVDESLRKEKLKNDILGCITNFKHIEVD